MDWTLFFQDTLQVFLASSPTFLLIVSNLRTFKNKTRETVNGFPAQLDGVKKEMVNAVDLVKETAKKEIISIKQNLEKTMEDKFAEFKAEFTKPLVEVSSEFKKHAESIQTLLDTNIKLVKENKTYQEVLGILISKDPNAIENNVAAYVADKLGVSVEQLKQFPKEIVNSLPQLKAEMKSTLELIGVQAFETLMKEIGYERKEKELPSS